MSVTPEPQPVPEPPNMVPVVLEAIVRLKCVSATYNRVRMILAPHILYTRNEALYVDAVTISKEGILREEKVGTFKLDGLRDLTLLDRDFAISDVFDPTLEKYQGTALMAVERGAAA